MRKFVATDGTTFNDKESCVSYEKFYSKVPSYYHLFDSNKVELKATTANEIAVNFEITKYIKVDPICEKVAGEAVIWARYYNVKLPCYHGFYEYVNEVSDWVIRKEN